MQELPAHDPPPRRGSLLRPPRIGQRLALGFGALVALLLVALASATLQLRLVNDLTDRFAAGDIQRLLRVQALSLQTEGVGSALIRLMNAPRDNRVKEYTDVDERNRRIDGIVDALVNELQDTEQEETLKRLQARRSVYMDAFIATVDEVEGGDQKAAAKVLNEVFNPALKALLGESNALLERERQRVEGQLQTAQKTFKLLMWLVLAVSLVVVAIAAWLAWLTTRSVVRPLSVLEAVAQSMARGDYGERLAPTGTQEVDRVIHALNTMAHAVSQREEHIVRLAYEDALTGLPNRTALLSPLHGYAIRPNCVMVMDLARLKVINETLGYATGDTLIKEIASRTTTVFQAAVQSGLIGPDPVVARLSGGIFAAAFSIANRSAAQGLYQRLERAMAAPVQCSGHSVDLSVACGFAEAGTQYSDTPAHTLMRNAEVALHTAKRAAVGHAWHSEAQEAQRLSHLNLVSDLRHAVSASQLEMWLQPKFSLATGAATGAEALVRWRHPTRGFVSPAEFIPFAEQTGYITMVTDWMLREAIRTLAVWRKSHPALSISVNVSTRDLLDGGFVKRVQHLLHSHGVEPQLLFLEVTESGLMEDPAQSVATLQALRDTGIGLSIDDFGTGYSSLAYLQKLPVCELKIDRSFVDGIDMQQGTQKLLRAMVEMGHGLDMTVTAEGVETEAEREVIARLGCDVMQGYLGSRPLHGEALADWLRNTPFVL
jgi:diguanylate cyclase (GGDEF)-like protein